MMSIGCVEVFYKSVEVTTTATTTTTTKLMQRFLTNEKRYVSVFNQSGAKPDLQTFSRLWCRLQTLTTKSAWLVYYLTIIGMRLSVI